MINTNHSNKSILNLSILALATLIGLAGCSTQSIRPIIDTKNSRHSPAQYERDLAECQDYASQRDPVGGAIIAGLLVGAIGHALTKNSYYGSRYSNVAGGAAAGGVMADGRSKQEDIVVRCLTGRGYNVIGK